MYHTGGEDHPLLRRNSRCEFTKPYAGEPDMLSVGETLVWEPGTEQWYVEWPSRELCELSRTYARLLDKHYDDKPEAVIDL